MNQPLGNKSARSFALADQEEFARLSGDRNPLHLDPLLARRLIFGQPVVHGIHLLLWSLEQCLAGRQGPWALERLRVDFRRHLGLGQEVTCRVSRQEEGTLEVELLAGGAPVAWWEAGLAPADSPAPGPPPPLPPDTLCHELSAQEASQAKGALALGLDPELLGRLFPGLAQSLPARQVALILATTRLVGMHCPGMHSVYAGLELDFNAPQREEWGKLEYEVSRFEPVFSLLWLALKADGCQGSIKAFVRPGPRRQAGMEQLKDLVQPGEFAGWQSLVIGGSRGLGEVAAKLLASGGAQVVLTYNQGQADAQAVVEAIRRAGGQADCLALDVLAWAENPLAGLEGMVPNNLCYFATPFIAKGAGEGFSPKSFAHFSDFYVQGFLALVQAALALGPPSLRVLYPSSVAVEELPADMREYAAAKLAGEAICGFLRKSQPQALRLWAPRFPRLDTDQMPTFLPVPSADPAPPILAALRALKNL